PCARAQVDPERTDAAIIAPRVEGAPLDAVAFPARQPLHDDGRAVGARRVRDAPECDLAGRCHLRRLRRKSGTSNSRVRSEMKSGGLRYGVLSGTGRAAMTAAASRAMSSNGR